MGYPYVEVPWLVPTEITKITYNGLTDFRTPKGDLIGSGEQAFLYLQKEESLIPGKYHTITPCFRDEPETNWNFQQFMKLELYVTDDTNESNLLKIIEDCKTCLEKATLKKLKILQTEEFSYDLIYQDNNYQEIELGSYSIMTHKDLRWICATGIAEPRTSQVAKL